MVVCLIFYLVFQDIRTKVQLVFVFFFIIVVDTIIS